MSFSSAEKKNLMQLAFQQAQKAQTLGEVPIGAIVVAPDGQVVGEGFNRRDSTC